MDRTQKREVVAELHEVFNDTASVVVTHYSGLNVAQITDLRRQMRDAGATFRVTKNRLTKLALDGTPNKSRLGANAILGVHCFTVTRL